MVTIIVPTYNEEENIKKFQNNLSKLEGDFEIIFSDGFSTDRTYDLIKYKKIRQAKYRSNQMNEAVKYAQGDILWFLHADSMVDPLSIKKIEESDLFNQAEADFKLALQQGLADKNTGELMGRADNATVKAYLTQIYLYEHRWDEAKILLEEIISYGYELLPNSL